MATREKRVIFKLFQQNRLGSNLEMQIKFDKDRQRLRIPLKIYNKSSNQTTEGRKNEGWDKYSFKYWGDWQSEPTPRSLQQSCVYVGGLTF